MARYVATAQAVYFLLSGSWPIVHLRSFLWVTGPKTDLWLVQSFGALVVAVGAALLYCRVRGEERAALPFGLCTAVALATVDVVFVSRGIISEVYLLDAVAETVIAAGWLVSACFSGARPPI